MPHQTMHWRRACEAKDFLRILQCPDDREAVTPATGDVLPAW
jgi:hypothetical protein